MAANRNRDGLDGIEREPRGTGKASDARDRVDRDDIARRAYLKFEARGQGHGHDQEDWLEAEREAGVDRGSSSTSPLKRLWRASRAPAPRTQRVVRLARRFLAGEQGVRHRTIGRGRTEHGFATSARHARVSTVQARGRLTGVVPAHLRPPAGGQNPSPDSP